MSTPSTCSCPDPIAVERATRKGAAQTVCARCGRPIALRLPIVRRAA